MKIGHLNVAEVARHLGCHPNTVKRIPPRELPFFRIGSRGDRRYELDDICSYIERHREIA